MSVDAKAEIVIERPRSTVAKIMFDPKNDKLWVGGLTNVFPLTPGALKKDSRFDRVGTFLGRAYTGKFLVIRDESERMLEMSSDEPFELKLRYELEDADGGTRVRLRMQGIVDHQYQMPPAVLNKAVADALDDDLKKLKRHLELSEPPAATGS